MICFKYTERFIVCSAAYNNRIWVTPFHTVIIDIIDSVILNFSNLEFDIITLVIFLVVLLVAFLICVLLLWIIDISSTTTFQDLNGQVSSMVVLQSLEITSGDCCVKYCLIMHALTYGPLFVWWYFFSPLVVISSPEFIKHGIVTLNLPKAPSTYVTV